MPLECQSPQAQITTVMQESRLFPPPAEFSAKCEIDSHTAYRELYDRAKANPEAFWAEIAREELHWFEPFGKTLEWKEPYAKWFVGGKTNVSYNCLDAHLAAGHGNKAALIWEGEPGDTRTLTYAELHREVCKFANVLKTLGIEAGRRRLDLHADGARAGDRHAGLRRIGAIHSVIFAGFSAEAIADRNNDAKAKLSDHRRRRLAARQGAAARSKRSTKRWPNRRPSRSASCSSASATKSTHASRAATSGGTS